VKPTPPDWPRLSPSLYYDDPHAAIDFLERAFGFATRIKVLGDDNMVEHSELVYGGAVVMVSDARRRAEGASPRSIDGRNTASFFLYVDDADAHCARARAAGAAIVSEPKDSDYGPEYWADRGYGALDPEGHHWWFATRVRDPSAA